MFNVVASIEIERPTAAVFDLIGNIRRMPEWIDSCVAVRVEKRGPIGAGTQFTHTSKFINRRFEIPFLLTEFEPPRVLTMRTREGGPFMTENRVELAPTGTGTRVTATFSGDATRFYKLAEPVLTRAFEKRVRQSLRTLKQALEADVSVAR